MGDAPRSGALRDLVLSGTTYLTVRQALSIGIGVVGVVGLASALIGLGYVYPQPDCCGSGGGSSMMLLADRVRAQHGELTISSEPGRGTRLMVWLPFAPRTTGPPTMARLHRGGRA